MTDAVRPVRVCGMQTLTIVAGGQAGLVTTGQAHRLGWDRRALLHAVRAGDLVHLGRGLYALPSPDLAGSEGRLRALSRGALLIYPDGILSHASGVLAYKLPLASPHRRASILRPVQCQIMTQSFVIHPLVDEKPIRTPLGPAVPPARAVAQLTMDSGILDGVVAGDAALHHGLFTSEDLDEVAASVRGWPLSARLSTAISLMDGRSESVGETRLRIILQLAGIAVTPQTLLRDGSGRVIARVDFLVEGTNVVIEFDGLVKYADGGVKALVAEKRREDLIRSLGYLVVRVTWDELSRPGVLLARIRHVMRQADLGAAAAR